MAKSTEISRDLSLLHPVFRASVQEVLNQMRVENIPFRVFEAYRSPERQAHLFAQGRTRPGSKVTNSLPWQSFHQYGLAADFVLYLDKGWSWDGGREFAHCWDRLQDVGEFYGLRGLTWERPHLELAVAEISDLQRAMYPAGGDQVWWDNLQLHIAGWKGIPKAPKRLPSPSPAMAPVE